MASPFPFGWQVEDDSKMGSVEDIATAVHEILGSIQQQQEETAAMGNPAQHLHLSACPLHTALAVPSCQWNPVACTACDRDCTLGWHLMSHTGSKDTCQEF